jgi:hypothetical protein
MKKKSIGTGQSTYIGTLLALMGVLLIPGQVSAQVFDDNDLVTYTQTSSWRTAAARRGADSPSELSGVSSTGRNRCYVAAHV